jgi:FkbM family methyltransferase
VRILRVVLPPSRLSGLKAIIELRDRRRFNIAAEDYLEWYLFLFGAYEPEIANLLPYLTDGNGALVDVGANIGIHSLTMAKLVGRGMVFAFEPHPTTADRLRSNLALNDVEDVVVVLQVALLDEERQVSLYDSKGPSKGMATLHSYDGWQEIAVRGTTLDNVVEARSISDIHLLKVDVEGYEAQVITGAAAVLARDRPSVIFEYVDWAWRNCGFSLDATLETMRSIGYEEFYVIRRNGLVALPNPMRTSGNILAVGKVVRDDMYKLVRY